jgi:hypothetical protein
LDYKLRYYYSLTAMPLVGQIARAMTGTSTSAYASVFQRMWMLLPVQMPAQTITAIAQAGLQCLPIHRERPNVL